LVQNVFNGVLFVPLGILLALVLSLTLWWIAPIACGGLSVCIELTQHYFIPERLGSIADVVSNTVGALIGVLLLLIFRRIRKPRVRRQTNDLEKQTVV
jgi:glycopeptide antibiotics resistance protein